MERRSNNRAPKPEPVPPPKEWKTRKPCREEQLSGKISRGLKYGRFISPTGHPADAVNDVVHKLLSDGIVTTSICRSSISLCFLLMFSLNRTVVGRVFLSANQQLRVEELAVVTGTDLINRLATVSVISSSQAFTCFLEDDCVPMGRGQRRSNGGRICRCWSR